MITSVSKDYLLCRLYSHTIYLDLENVSLLQREPGRVAHWVGYLTRDLDVTGSIPGLRQTFVPVPFRLSPLIHVRKAVSGFGEKNCVSTGVRKPGNT